MTKHSNYSQSSKLMEEEKEKKNILKVVTRVPSAETIVNMKRTRYNAEEIEILTVIFKYAIRCLNGKVSSSSPHNYKNDERKKKAFKSDSLTSIIINSHIF